MVCYQPAPYSIKACKDTFRSESADQKDKKIAPRGGVWYKGPFRFFKDCAMSKRFANLPHTPEEVTIWRFKMPVDRIGYFNSIYEAHEAICLVNTVDKRLGLVECSVMPSYKKDFEIILERLLEPCQVTILEKDRPYHG